MSTHWERKMNPSTRKPARAIRPKATSRQVMQAFDLIADGTSRREAARTAGISETAIRDLPGWTPKECADWALQTPLRRKVVGA